MKGALAGAVAGLAGAWTMNQYSAVSQKVQDAWKKSAHQPEQNDPQSTSDQDDATMKVADRLSSLFTHRSLTKEQKQKAGPIVHYAFGAILGAFYGVLAELSPVVAKGSGTAFASAVWLTGDEMAVPALGLSGPPNQYPLSAHANALGSHLVFGATTDVVRRAIRREA
jgi:hypothetical protein